MKRISIKEILSNYKIGQEVIIKGWVRFFRSKRFLIINDGSSIKNIQIFVDEERFNSDLLEAIKIGASISVSGRVIESKGSGQDIEIEPNSIELLGQAKTEDISKTILQPKKHSIEKIREQSHLRFKTNLFGAVLRIRHGISFAIHSYFNNNGFYYLNTPILTSSDAEGAGESFKLKDSYFFGKEMNLTVSGQLEAELATMGLGKVYTFGPTFRAENSNTSRHLAEFWMVEPEVAFHDLSDNIELAEDFLKYICKYVLRNCKDDLIFLSERENKEELSLPKDKRNELNLIERLKYVSEINFIKITYSDAVDILLNSKEYKKGRFKNNVEWGIDFNSEHERYLVEKHFKRPVIITDYPSKVKAFYMRTNDNYEDGKKTVAAMDILFPGVGEIIGGSQREERLDILKQKCVDFGIDAGHLNWYLDTRKIGTVPHSGFGLGLERMVMFATGMKNIRDVIPFPRTVNNGGF